MSDHEHRWSPTCLVGPEGALYSPCLENSCQAALLRTHDGEKIIPTGWGMSVDGFDLDIEDDPAGGVAKIVLCEIASTYRLPTIPIEAGDTIVDIGAHVGVVSIYLALKYPGTRIIAVEPDPDNYARLVRNLQANGAGNVIPLNVAVSDTNAPVTLWRSPHQNSGGASAFIGGTPQMESALVPAITLRQLWNEQQLGRVKLLKLDCEGAEYAAILADPTVLDTVDHLVAEVHTNARLRRQGYTPDGLARVCARHLLPEHVWGNIVEIAA